MSSSRSGMRIAQGGGGLGIAELVGFMMWKIQVLDVPDGIKHKSRILELSKRCFILGFQMQTEAGSVTRKVRILVTAPDAVCTYKYLASRW